MLALSAIQCTCRIECRPRLEAARHRIVELEAAVAALRVQLREVVKHDELQRQDLDRLREEHERTRPNCPERVPGGEAQLAFTRILETFGDVVAAKDEVRTSGASTSESPGKKGDQQKRRHRHGRRRLDLTNLPVETVPIDPPEVKATGGAGFIRIGQETSERLAFRPAQYFRLRPVRSKWMRVRKDEGPSSLPSADAPEASTGASEAPAMLAAPLPGGVWPTVMADPSAVAQIVVSKYDDVLPLHRQERISVRHGFARRRRHARRGVSNGVLHRDGRHLRSSAREGRLGEVARVRAHRRS